MEFGQTAVYLLYGYEPYQTCFFGALLYVGVTHYPIDRWRTHSREKDWWPDVLLIEQRNCSSRDDALEHEAQLIDAHDPVHNRTGRGYWDRCRQQQKNQSRLPRAIESLTMRWELPA